MTSFLAATPLQPMLYQLGVGAALLSMAGGAVLLAHTKLRSLARREAAAAVAIGVTVFACAIAASMAAASPADYRGGDQRYLDYRNE
jgi:uncharacterized membrane protein